MDAGAPGLLVAQAIGRIGNYFNQELFGGPTNLPWALQIDAGAHPAGLSEYGTTFQPTFLYEMIFNLALAGFLIWLGRTGRIKAARTVRAVCHRLQRVSHLGGDAAHRSVALHLRAAAEPLRRRDIHAHRLDVVHRDPATPSAGSRLSAGHRRHRSARGATHADVRAFEADRLAGSAPARISSANSRQPTQNPKIDSRPEAAIIPTSRTSATVWSWPTSATSAMAIVITAPIACAKRFGGPGTGLAAPRRGATSRVASLPERAERRAGEDAGDEAVGEQRGKPVRAGDERHDREREDAGRDDARGLLVDRVGEAEQRCHRSSMIRSSPIR